MIAKKWKKIPFDNRYTVSPITVYCENSREKDVLVDVKEGSLIFINDVSKRAIVKKINVFDDGYISTWIYTDRGVIETMIIRWSSDSDRGEFEGFSNKNVVVEIY